MDDSSKILERLKVQNLIFYNTKRRVYKKKKPHFGGGHMSKGTKISKQNGSFLNKGIVEASYKSWSLGTPEARFLLIIFRPWLYIEKNKKRSPLFNHLEGFTDKIIILITNSPTPQSYSIKNHQHQSLIPSKRITWK